MHAAPAPCCSVRRAAPDVPSSAPNPARIPLAATYATKTYQFQGLPLTTVTVRAGAALPGRFPRVVRPGRPLRAARRCARPARHAALTPCPLCFALPPQFADLPSSSPVAHADVLAAQCDAVILVADASDPAWAGKAEGLLPTVRALLRPRTRIRAGAGMEHAGAILPRPGADPGPGEAAAAGGEPAAWFPVLLCLNKADKRPPTPSAPTPDQLASHHRCLLARVSARTGDGVPAALHPFLYTVLRASGEQRARGSAGEEGEEEGGGSAEGHTTPREGT